MPSQEFEWTLATTCPHINSSHLFCHKANQYQSLYRIFTNGKFIQTSKTTVVFGKAALEILLSCCWQKDNIRFSSITILRCLRPPDGGPRCPRQNKTKNKKQKKTKHSHSWLSRDFTGGQNISVHYCPELRPAAVEREPNRLWARAAGDREGLWEW